MDREVARAEEAIRDGQKKSGGRGRERVNVNDRVPPQSGGGGDEKKDEDEFEIARLMGDVWGMGDGGGGSSVKTWDDLMREERRARREERRERNAEKDRDKGIPEHLVGLSAAEKAKALRFKVRDDWAVGMVTREVARERYGKIFDAAEVKSLVAAAGGSSSSTSSEDDLAAERLEVSEAAVTADDFPATAASEADNLVIEDRSKVTSAIAGTAVEVAIGRDVTTGSYESISSAAAKKSAEERPDDKEDDGNEDEEEKEEEEVHDGIVAGYSKKTITSSTSSSTTREDQLVATAKERARRRAERVAEQRHEREKERERKQRKRRSDGASASINSSDGNWNRNGNEGAWHDVVQRLNFETEGARAEEIKRRADEALSMVDAEVRAATVSVSSQSDESAEKTKQATGQGDGDVNGSGGSGMHEDDDVNFAGVDPGLDGKFESEESHLMKGFGMGGTDEDVDPEPN